MNDSAESWCEKGDALRAGGDIPAALSAYNQAIRIKPDFAAACENLARLLEIQGSFDVAIKTYTHWLKIIRMPKKSVPPASDGALQEMQRLFSAAQAASTRTDYAAAITAYEKILSLHPDTPNVLILLGVALCALPDRLKEAEPYFVRALSFEGSPADALHALAQYYLSQRRYAAAAAALTQYLASRPDSTGQLWIELGKAYFFMQMQQRAIHAYEEAAKLQPNNINLLTELLRMHTYFCNWDDAIALQSRITMLMRGNQAADPCITVSFYHEGHVENARRWASTHYPHAKPYSPNTPLPADRRGDKKLRIGYVSSDFHHHATAFLIGELFELHDRDRFTIYAYSHGRDDHSDERQRIVRAVDCFRDIAGLDDAEAAAIILSDGIDILVDLKGYTLGHRLSLIATRPAPLQIHYLGYPASTGLPAIDYFVADAFTAPQNSASNFSEALIRLPHSYQINDRKRLVPEAALPRSVFGLPEQAFVFCAFNNPYKITSEIFAAWMRILAATDNSVLWLYESQPGIGEKLRAQAATQGIDPARLVMASPMPANQHLIRHLHADLALDTAPVCGHTTTSDALWAGVPIITLYQNSFISRVAAGLLRESGLEELAFASLPEYEAEAIALAHDPARLQRYKHHLRSTRLQSPVFDSAATTRALETAYLHATELHRKGIAPRAFSIANHFAVVED